MGTIWHRSGTIERYGDDLPAVGAQAFFFMATTNTPFVVFKDSSEASAHAHPVLADSRGRWPDVFIPTVDAYDVQVKTRYGVQLTYSQSIPGTPISASVTSGDPTELQTGMIIFELSDNERAGFVRCNGQVIGSTASSASVPADSIERCNDDTINLYTYLWNNLSDEVAQVNGGRGVSPTADFNAPKAMALPDMRGYAIAGTSSSGNPGSTVLDNVPINYGTDDEPGADLGLNTTTLAIGNLPAHSHSGGSAAGGAHTHTGTTNVDGSHDHQTGVDEFNGTQGKNYVMGANFTNDLLTISSGSSTHSHNFSIASSGSHTHTFTTNEVGSDTPINNMPRTRLGTYYIKL